MSIQMYIPAIGDEIILEEDWTFDLYDESRNDTLFEILKIEKDETLDWRQRQTATYPATIPAGVTLKIDRIYIRKGLTDFDSVTFLWKGASTDQKLVERWGRIDKIPRKPCRFWAKLKCVNTIKFRENP